MARPCKIDTKRIDRKLNDAERLILLTAGQGDLTRGFQLLLTLYRVLHDQGYRPDHDLSAVRFSDKVMQNIHECT